MDREIYIVDAGGYFRGKWFRQTTNKEEVKENLLVSLGNDLRYAIEDLDILVDSDPELANIIVDASRGNVRSDQWTVSGEFQMPSIEIKAHTEQEAIDVVTWALEVRAADYMGREMVVTVQQ